jgi:hypothetical protein
MSDGFGELNAIGEARYVGQTMGGEGGNNMKGPLDNFYPTAIIARGNELRADGGTDKGERKNLSYQRNTSKARMGGMR